MEDLEEQLLNLQGQLALKTETLEQVTERLQQALEELQRIAVSSSDLLRLLAESQEAGDRLRDRLQKVLLAYDACQRLLLAVEAQDPRVAELRAVYSRAQLSLET